METGYCDQTKGKNGSPHYNGYLRVVCFISQAVFV